MNAAACFADHLLNVAAGTTVDACAYRRWEGRINMLKLRALGEAFRKGWLHNLLGRITPLTTRDHTDYEMMADLFITEAAAATTLLERMSRDLSAFAVAAGLAAGPRQPPPPEMILHLSIYRRIGKILADKFRVEVPEPFASTVIDAALQQRMPFIREFMRRQRAA